VPVLASVAPNLPETFEMLAATQSNAGRMIRAGVKVALVPIGRDYNHQVRLIPQQAGNLVAQGAVPGGVAVSHAEALAAITRVPAEIFGLGNELGTLEPGKRADVVVWSGDPIDLAAAPTAVFIDGRPVALESRQTKLRDRYNPLRQDGMPKQYGR
jgi:imidazolonepropionase-like amidohydrolase